MRNEQFFTLRNKILSGLSTLICLEDDNGDFQISNKEITNTYNLKKIEYQLDYPYLSADPRINFMKQILKNILTQNKNYASLSFAFRLKRLKDWLVRTDPSSFVTQMAWNCKANCIFCYQKGNPPFMKCKKRISQEEINTRLKYFDAKYGLVAGDALEGDEVLNNPHIVEILRTIKNKAPDKIMQITTNGTSLTPKMVKALAQFKPLQLIISLTSADPKIRRWLMNDLHPEVAISSLPLLKKHKISFIINIVVWPGLPFSDIKKTIRYAEQNDAYAVRLFLPGYTRFFSKSKVFDAKTYWTKIVKYFFFISKKYKIPIIITPNMFVQNLVYERVDLPLVIGTIKNSPAHDCGIKPHDLIKEINGQPIDSIEEAVNALRRHRNHSVTLKIARGKTICQFIIKDKQKDHYPYCFRELRRDTPLGFVLAGRYFSHDDALNIADYISLHEAKNVLVLCSSGARPLLKYLLKKYKIETLSNSRIRLVTTKSRFYGGNIVSGDLLVADDFIKTIKQNTKKHKPDLIILPSSPFTNWGRDLIGRVNLEIEREVGIPVEFIYNKTNQLLY